MPAIVTLEFDRLALDLIVAGGMWQSIHLFQNNFTPTKSSVIGDFTEATYSGYSTVNFVWGAAFINGTPKGQVNAGSVTFIRGLGATDNTVYGMYVMDAGNTIVTAFELFPAPISMVIPFFDTVFYQFSPTAIDG